MIKEKPKKTIDIYGSDFHKRWRLSNGKLHRKDGPAHIASFSNYEGWSYNGKYHRENGPARTWSNHPSEYWLDGLFFPKEEYEAMQCKQCGHVRCPTKA